MVPDAGKIAFGIAGARKRPIPALLPSGTCAQTPRDRHEIHFRRELDAADAPKTSQNGGFHHESSAAQNPEKNGLLHREPRSNLSFARRSWLRNFGWVHDPQRPPGVLVGPKSGHRCAPRRPSSHARHANQRQKPAAAWFSSTPTALSPILVHLCHLCALMATRVVQVQNAPKIVFFCLSPLCRVKPRTETSQNGPPRGIGHGGASEAANPTPRRP